MTVNLGEHRIVAQPSGCRIETRLNARRYECSGAKSVETSLDAADTSVRVTQTRHGHLLRAGLVTALALAACACKTSGEAEARAPEKSEAPTVAVVKVTTADLSHSVKLTAEFKPFQEIDVMAKVAGYIKEIRVDVGDRVKQGELLATLEIPEMVDDLARANASVARSTAEVARANDDIARAESAHNIAHLSYERLAEVSRKRPGLVAQQEIDDAHSKDLGAEAQLAAAKSNRAAAVQQVDVNKADLARVNTMHDYTRVTAPFAGVVTKRYADTGSMIQAGTASQTQAMPVIRLSENSRLRLILPVPESVVPRIRVGEQVEVNVPSLNRTFPGKVARFADKVQLTTRTMDTEVDVSNPSLVLIPGMYAEVNLTLDKRSGALAIPVSAVDAGATPNTGRVMLITSEQTVEARKVSLGLETADAVEVLSGLREGDLVMIGSRASIEAGQHVRPKITNMTVAKE
jgi:RND family efflux transporter MFP subunit